MSGGGCWWQFLFMTSKRLLEMGFTPEDTEGGYYYKYYTCGRAQMRIKILLWGDSMQALIDPTEHGNESTICFPKDETQLNHLLTGLGVD